MPISSKKILNSERSKESRFYRAKRGTVLIVEDEQSLRQTLVDKLTREGFDVLEAKNGEEGLERALKKHPDLILLDIIMPVMDGMTMMKKMREDKWGRKVPIILLTNLSATDAEIIKRVIEDEPSYYLLKSDWKIKDVVNKVKETLAL